MLYKWPYSISKPHISEALRSGSKGGRANTPHLGQSQPSEGNLLPSVSCHFLLEILQYFKEADAGWKGTYRDYIKKLDSDGHNERQSVRSLHCRQQHDSSSICGDIPEDVILHHMFRCS